MGELQHEHFESVCYHPLFLFNDQGDCLAASLRPGNVPSADDWDDLLMPEIDRQQGAGRRVAFLEPAVFGVKLFQALRVRDAQPAELAPPEVVTGLREPVPAAQVLHQEACLGLPAGTR